MATTVNTLETNTEVFKGDRVVADGVERTLGTVTLNTGVYSANFQVDGVDTALASIPTSVYRLDHDNLTIDGTPTATTATVLDSRTGLIASGDTVLLDGVGVVCNPVVEGTVVSTVANDEFETVLYTGNDSTKTIPMANITGSLDFAWIKGRTEVSSSIITDSIRGDGKELYSDLTNQEGTVNRVALTTGDLVINSAAYPNYSTQDYVAWCASLPNHTPSNTDGTITSETKSNSFMSAVTFTMPPAGTNAHFGTGLGKPVELFISKDRDLGTSSWYCGVNVTGASNLGTTDYFVLNKTLPFSTGSGASFVATDNDTLTIGHDTGYHDDACVAYCFTSVAGKCKVGSYTGTGAAGNAVDCGFEPAWVMIKRTDSVGSWNIYDNERTGTSYLLANQSLAEQVGVYEIDFNTAGFSLENTHGDWNASGGTYIYLAIAKDVDTTIPKYDLTYPTQTAPTRIALSNNDIVPTVASDVFDGTDTFTKTYNTVTKTARDVEYGFVADEEVEIVQLNLNQNMEP